ncbi:uncharacterized protein V6R79_015139 [Siganus canaliculatus]
MHLFDSKPDVPGLVQRDEMALVTEKDAAVVAADVADDDRTSLKSEGKTPTDGFKRESLMKTVRSSIRRVAEKSPLSSAGKGSKVTSQPPPSPSLSSGSPATSPLENGGGFFQKKDDDEAEVPPQKGKGLGRSKTEPNMSKFIKRGESIRRSLGFSKKNKDKSSKQEAATPLQDGAAEDGIKEEEEEEKEEEEEEEEEMEETYTLPDIPHTPLSVMQINMLIENEVLEEAHLNLLALRRDIQQQSQSCADDLSMELSKKEKDLRMLYDKLRDKINALVRDSNSLPSRNKGLLVHVARIIQEEEKRAEEPGGLPGSWMESWREAVGEGVRAKVASVHLAQREQNASWLAVHLGLLGKAIVEDLENVKRQLRWSYPRSFNVFSAYVGSYHRVVAQHLEKLEQQVTELKDLYALLDWILHRYQSERIMGSSSLRPEMTEESTELQLEDEHLERLRDKFCCRMREDMRASLDRVIELEKEEFWSVEKSPEKEDDFLDSQIHMDIWTTVKGNVVNSRQLDAHLEKQVSSSCLEELKDFPKRFEDEFRRHCGALNPQPLWTEYNITYINSFAALQQHMEGYQDACPGEVEGFRREVNKLIIRLMQDLEDQFKEDVKVYLRRMMTRKWLTHDEDFKELKRRTELLSHHCSLMRPPHSQEFASRLHFHVTREYVGQLMKNNYSCKNRKHERAATKIRQQWSELTDLFEDMRSTHEWLHPVGDDLSNIIGQRNKTSIKNFLQPVVEHYPDFSKKHLVAVLYFRGLLRGREHQLILQKLAELKKKLGDGNRSQVLFSDMQVTVSTDCLPNLPYSCFSFLLPDN